MTATALSAPLAAALHDAEAGQAVAVVASIGTSLRQLRDVFEWVAAEAEARGSVERIRRANGAERIDFDLGGQLRFLSSAVDLRGRTFDRVIPLSAPR